MAKLTKRVVDGMDTPGTTPLFLWDDALPGFGVKLMPTGAKKYLLKYRVGRGRGAAQRWMSIGTHGVITCDQARTIAQRALGSVARGEDPQPKVVPAVVRTLSDVWRRFELEQLDRKKAQTRREYVGQWRDLIEPALGKAALDEISRSDIDRLHKKLSAAPYRANRVLALLSRLFSLAEAWDWRAQGTNPCKYVERFRETARARYLSHIELARLGDALSDQVGAQLITPAAANAIKLLLMTGARLNEILTAKWDSIDPDRRVLELTDSKTGKKVIYLSRASLAVIDAQRQNNPTGSEFIFPGRSSGHMINLRKPWVRVCAHANIAGVRLHDLRHTAASISVGLGTSLPIIGRLLGHSQAQTTMRYAHVDVDPAIAAADALGAAMTSAMSGG